MIDIKEFLIVSTTEFDSLIQELGITLLNYEDTYMLTYLFTNFLAYFIIFIFLYVVKILYYSFFKTKKTRSW